jgi:hypothetical protein
VTFSFTVLSGTQAPPNGSLIYPGGHGPSQQIQESEKPRIQEAKDALGASAREEERRFGLPSVAVTLRSPCLKGWPRQADDWWWTIP